MPLNVSVSGPSLSPGFATFFGSWTGADFSCGPGSAWFQWGYDETGFAFFEGPFGPTSDSSGNYQTTVGIAKDRNSKFRGFVQDCNGQKNSSNIQFRSHADPMSMFGLTPGQPTTTSCPVSGGIIPNTDDSAATVVIQYRVQGTSVWTETGPVATDLRGTGFIGLGGNLSGLTPATTYEARYKADRDSANATQEFSGIGVFTTLSDGPPKTIVLAAALLSTGFLPITTQVSSKTIEIPIMSSLSILILPDDISSPELTKLVELEVFMVDKHPLDVKMH